MDKDKIRAVQIMIEDNDGETDSYGLAVRLIEYFNPQPKNKPQMPYQKIYTRPEPKSQSPTSRPQSLVSEDEINKGITEQLYDVFAPTGNSLVSEDETKPDCLNCQYPVEWAEPETDTEIAKRKIEEYVEETLKDTKESCPVAREFRAIFNGCINWLDKESE